MNQMKKDKLIFVGMVVILWAIFLWGGHWPVYFLVWKAASIIAFYGALILGPIGIVTIVMDLYRENKTKVI